MSFVDMCEKRHDEDAKHVLINIPLQFSLNFALWSCFLARCPSSLRRERDSVTYGPVGGQGAALRSWLDTFRTNKNSTHASFLEYSSSVLTGESRSSGRPREGAMSACRVAAPLRGRVTQPVDGS